uniref:MMS19 nucleotide excision repair protein n=1 Tax=Elaeophora elaphi TaxID=1147741 RepID=A0A0R3RQM4_9BILA
MQQLYTKAQRDIALDTAVDLCWISIFPFYSFLNFHLLKDLSIFEINKKKGTMAGIDEDLCFVNQWVDKICNGKPSTLFTFIESFRSEMECKDRIRGEHGLKRICSVVSKLPRNYPWKLSQVELLMNFFLMNYGNFDTANYFILIVLKRMIMNDLHIANNYIRRLVDVLFGQQQVQTYAQRERFLLYQILDILLDKYSKELSTNAYFVSYFISSISGERDPRCLILIFRLFCTICKYFNSGDFPRNLFDVHASDLFDVVACYYPIEFNHNSKERTEITKELLISGCESCLLIDKDFAPLVFDLIIEKLLDNEYSTDTKLEVCSFLAKACAVFPCSQLVVHVDQLCAGIRLILLNLPKNIRDDYIPEPVSVAISSVLKAFTEGNIKVPSLWLYLQEDQVSFKNFNNFRDLKRLEYAYFQDKEQRIECICQEFIDKSEMFVLQTELGLTHRILAFFEILLRSSESSFEIVFENVFSWLLSLCKGDTARSTANKSEVVNASLKLLRHWIDIASDFKQVTLLRKYHISLIEMLDKYDREIVQLTRYKLLEVCLNLHVHTNELLEKCIVFLRESFDIVCSENKKLRNSCLLFVHAFAVANWIIVKDLFVEEIDSNKEIFHLTPLLWSLIHDIDSLDFVLSYLGTLFPSPSAYSDDFQEIFLEMFKNNKSNMALEERLLKQSLACFFIKFELGVKSIQDLEAQSKLLQQIGLIINERTHFEGLRMIRKKLGNCSSSLPGLYLYIIQSPCSDELLEVLTQLASVDQDFTWYKSLVMAALVNRSPNYVEMLNHMEKVQKNFEFLDRFKCKARLCAALLLIDRPEGPAYFAALLRDLVQYYDSEDITILTNTLMDVLIFDTCYSDPVKCKYRTTFLWQQRMFYQLVPIYVQYFNDLSQETSEFRDRRIVLFPLLSPLYALAASSTAVMNDKYVELLPVLCAALDTSELDLCLEGQIISSLATLLKNATAKQLGHDLLLKVLPRLQHCLDNSQDMMIHITALECLQLIAHRWSSTTLLPFYDPIVRSLIKTSGSQKRIVRIAVSNVRNLWYFLSFFVLGN